MMELARNKRRVVVSQSPAALFFYFRLNKFALKRAELVVLISEVTCTNTLHRDKLM